jgi:molybdopterin converting factor small subunit
MDATAGAASSDSDAETGPDALTVELASSSRGSSSSSSKGGRSRRQQRQQAGLAADAQLVNVNNRLVSEDTVLQDGDLVILAREKIKI